MKTKKINKRLKLNKETLVHLDQQQMANFVGGLTVNTHCPEDDRCISTPWLCETIIVYPPTVCIACQGSVPPEICNP